MDFEKYVIDTLNAIKEDQTKVLVQTTKTNGRVISLEAWKQGADKDISDLKNLTNENKGRDKTLLFIIGGGGAILGMVIEHFVFK